MIDTLYQTVCKPIFFRQDPEKVHENVTRLGVLLGSSPLSRSLTRHLFYFRHHALQTTVAGIRFDNPIGLAAGFDKNCRLYNILPEVGFGFAELGSVTGEPCQGNPRPRLFRIPPERSILVNYGLCNDGADAISTRLARVSFRFPVGFSVAKTNDPLLDTKAGIEDYRKAFVRMHPLGSYTTINVSCPNTSDGQTFGHPEHLSSLLNALAKEKHLKPVFVKLKPDMNPQLLTEVVQIVNSHPWISGFILSNLTMNRNGLATPKEAIDQLSMHGGLSGLPTQQRSLHTIEFVAKNSDKTIIGCGGVFTGRDAYEKIRHGASLIQLVTALIYEGPGVVSRINRELVDLLQKDGFATAAEAVRSSL